MLPELRAPVPGPLSRQWVKRLGAGESRNVTFVSEDSPIFWEKAEGTNVWDSDGNRYLDLTSAFGVAGLGHRHPAIEAAITSQAKRLWHAMGDVHPSPLKAELCEKLVAMTFGRWGLEGRVILGNSGFEAVEAAIKSAHLATGRPGIIAFGGSYHGLGFGALDATGWPFFREPFLRQLKQFTSFATYPTCYRCPFGCREGFRLIGRDAPACSSRCLDKIRKEFEGLARKRQIGAILVEPVQGRGGEWFPPHEFLPMLRGLATEHELLLIVDEIYTGLWRTGHLWACEAVQVVPDVLCTAKALAGGFPISACIGRRDLIDAWPESKGDALHTSTHLGNPLGCAMAIASLDAWSGPEWAGATARIGQRFYDGLARIKGRHLCVGNVRGRGALWAMDIVTESGDPDAARCNALVSAALAKGLILLSAGTAGNVVSIAPPLIITDDEIAWAIDCLDALLAGG